MNGTTVLTLRDRLPTTDDPLGHMRANIWERFVSRAVEALYEASEVLAQKRLPFDHETVNGYWRAGQYNVRGTQVEVPEENGITDALVRALQNIGEAVHETDPINEYEIYFAQQQPRAIQNSLGSKAYTTDIQIRSRKLAYLDLRIEAKVLFSGADATAYCGQQGLLRFAHPEPYTDQIVGMMLGYSIRQSDEHWLTRIQQKSQPQTCVLDFDQLKIGARDLYGSTLSSHATGKVVVLHLLLPFNSRPSSRDLDQARAAQNRS